MQLDYCGLAAEAESCQHSQLQSTLYMAVQPYVECLVQSLSVAKWMEMGIMYKGMVFIGLMNV